MNINVTLIIQMLVFAIVIWVMMKFIWPIILGAMNEREKKIAAGLAAAEQGQKDLSEAKTRADEVIKEARARAMTIESQAQSRANQIIEEARKAAGSRARRHWPRPSRRSSSRAPGRAISCAARWSASRSPAPSACWNAKSTPRRTASCSTSWRRSCRSSHG